MTDPQSCLVTCAACGCGYLASARTEKAVLEALRDHREYVSSQKPS